MTTNTSEILHFQNCTSSCLNSSIILELVSRTLLNLRSQKNELNNPDMICDHRYAARTLRPKIHRLLPDFLVEYPNQVCPVVLQALLALCSAE